MTSFINNLIEKTKVVTESVIDTVNNVSSVATAAVTAANDQTKIITCDTAKTQESCTALFSSHNVKCAYDNNEKCVPCFGLNNTLCVEPCSFNNTTNTCS